MRFWLLDVPVLLFDWVWCLSWALLTVVTLACIMMSLIGWIGIITGWQVT